VTRRLAKRHVRRALARVRQGVYRLRFRPKPGTILYSPSLDMRYAWRDANPALGAMWGFRKPPLPRLEMAPGVEYTMTHRGVAMRRMVVTHMTIDSGGRATVEFEDAQQHREARLWRPSP
jgi:hypothetical protein